MTWTTAITITTLILAAVAIASLKALKETGKSKLEAKKPLSTPEQILFIKLTKALPEHFVLAQVAFSRFLKATGPNNKENYRAFAEIRQKVADYVICRKDFSIVAVIELDDKSHNETQDKKRDLKLESAGIKVIRWNVKNLPNNESIAVAINGEPKNEQR